MITIFDFETTGLDIATLEITQFAYTILNEDFKQVESKCICIKANIDDTSKASEITGLKYDFLQEYGKTQEEFLKILKEVYNKSNYLIAHNGKAFDFLILNRLLNVDCEKEKHCIDTIKDLDVLTSKLDDNNDFYRKKNLKTMPSLRDLIRETLNIHIPQDTNLLHNAGTDVLFLTALIVNLRATEQLFLNGMDRLKSIKTYRVFFKNWQKNLFANYKSDLKSIPMMDADGMSVMKNGRQQWEAKQLRKTDIELEKLKVKWKQEFDITHGTDYLFVKEEEYQKNKKNPFGVFKAVGFDISRSRTEYAKMDD